MSNVTLSPTVDERLITRHGDDDPIIAEMAAGVKLGRELAQKAGTMTQAVLRNELKTLPARHKEARAAGWGLIEQATVALDKVRAVAAAEVATIQQRLKGPPAPKDEVNRARHANLRDQLRAMPQERRVAIIEEALANGDDFLIAAVLSGYEWESGLTKAEMALHRHGWAKRRYPADVERLGRLEKAIADVDRIGPLLINFVDSLTDRDLIAQAERSERAAAEALRLVSSR